MHPSIHPHVMVAYHRFQNRPILKTNVKKTIKTSVPKVEKQVKVEEEYDEY